MTRLYLRCLSRNLGALDFDWVWSGEGTWCASVGDYDCLLEVFQ